ncbi:hypothetical protein SAMN05421636_105211 [Pricia antarctica]|uniref:Cytochrome C and Quinol oxidase polypeptide I n=1 Tax=Pricia antarctica TaxID=641691 RepID=A0A1G7D853_9FLAO|nr:hypothetical protein [Pricia antarctica]SDE47713.1 hypothetical protein SAMN05421636_105211 [Pricia antarctica]
MIDLKLHIRTAFAYFLMAALLGLVLRSYASIEIPVNYKFIVHTHSHIALLGWVYIALTTLIYKLFVASPLKDKKYRRIFWFTQLSLVGMLLTFPFTGYALFSIVFSTLFLFASYWFFWFFRKHGMREFKKTNAYACITAALWYLVLSSLGPWALGAVISLLGSESIWYRLAIYFYLHFLYNGWMIMALFGLFLHLLEHRQIKPSKSSFKKLFWSLNTGIILSAFLSTLFTKPPILVYIIGGVGGVLQLFALILLLWFLFPLRGRMKTIFSKWQWNLLQTVAVLLFVKMVLQLLTAFPYFANLAATFLDFTIGYLHWTFLGVVTIALFFFLDWFKLMRISSKAYVFYFTGFVITELLIFYKGLAAWQSLPIFKGYFEALAIGSSLIPLSLLLMLAFSWRGGQT